MKVILLADVPALGRRFEVKNVADGYGTNYLLPRKLARLATPQVLEDTKAKVAAAAETRKVQEELLSKNLSSLESVRLILSEKANEQGHLFAGITREMLVVALKKQTEIDILPEFIELDKPLKSLGEHTIAVAAHGKKARFVVVIEPTS